MCCPGCAIRTEWRALGQGADGSSLDSASRRRAGKRSNLLSASLQFARVLERLSFRVLSRESRLWFSRWEVELYSEGHQREKTISAWKESCVYQGDALCGQSRNDGLKLGVLACCEDSTSGKTAAERAARNSPGCSSLCVGGTRQAGCRAP